MQTLHQRLPSSLVSVGADGHQEREELERFNRATTRELRLIELMRQVNELAGELGRPEVFPPSFAEGTETEALVLPATVEMA